MLYRPGIERDSPVGRIIPYWRRYTESLRQFRINADLLGLVKIFREPSFYALLRCPVRENVVLDALGRLERILEVFLFPGTTEDLKEKYNVSSLENLTKNQCSRAIDELRKAA